MTIRMPRRKNVRFSFAPQSSCSPVLIGEISSWMSGIPLKYDGSEWVTDLNLPSGGYLYKYFSDGQWHLDQKNPRTFTSESISNNLLLIDGTNDSIIHAAGLPFTWKSPDGVLILRALLQKKIGQRLNLRWSDNNALSYHSITMDTVAEIDGYYWLETAIPTSGQSIFYYFELFHTGKSFLCGRSHDLLMPFCINTGMLTHQIPAWWRKAIVYEIFVDRFCTKEKAVSLSVNPQDRFGGTIEGIIQKIPYLEDMRVNTLYLTPIHLSGSSHRYDAIDHTSIDPEVGGENAFNLLLERLHEKDMRLILDLSFNHVSFRHEKFQDLLRLQQESLYSSWFKVKRYPVDINDPLSYECYNGNPQLPFLNMDNTDTQEFACSVIDSYCARGVDGFRIDAATDLPDRFLEKIACRVKAASPDILLFGEIIATGNFRYLEWMDARTAFYLHNQAKEMSGSKKIDCRQLAEVIQKNDFFRGGPAWTDVVFLNNHDTDRLLTILPDTNTFILWYTLLFTIPGVPCIYYGEEIGLKSPEASPAVFEQSWHDRLPMLFNDAQWNTDLRETVKSLIQLRKNYLSLSEGNIRILHATESTLVFIRSLPHERIVVAVNFDKKSFLYKIPAKPYETIQALFPSNAQIDGKQGSVTISPCCAAVFLIRSVGIDTVISRNPFAMSTEKPYIDSIGPRILYLSLTEYCNCSCAHCINDSGSKKDLAKEAQPWLLENLEPYFHWFEYLGFCEHGENMCAKLFDRCIERFRKAQRKEKATIHLLSNGMHSIDRFERIIEAGVNSLGISCDGLTPETNDVLRKGSNVSHIMKVLTLLCSKKKQLGVRIGVSTVLTKYNIEELPELVERLCSIGIDWFKLEEVFPVNDLCRAIDVSLNDPRIPLLLSALFKRCADTGTQFCNHLESSAWPLPCRSTQGQFLRTWLSDSYVNHVEIHPCKLPWETVCVDSAGWVKPLSFNQPETHNILNTPLCEIVNSPAFQMARNSALHIHETTGEHKCCTLISPNRA